MGLRDQTQMGDNGRKEQASRWGELAVCCYFRLQARGSRETVVTPLALHLHLQPS